MKTIAIIDDDIHIGDMLTEVLTQEGYAILRAYSGTDQGKNKKRSTEKSCRCKNAYANLYDGTIFRKAGQIGMQESFYYQRRNIGYSHDRRCKSFHDGH